MTESQIAIVAEVLSKGGKQKEAAKVAGVHPSLICKYLKTNTDFKKFIEKSAEKHYKRNLPKAQKNFNHAIDNFENAADGSELQKMGWSATQTTMKIYDNPGTTIQNIINIQDNTIITPLLKDLIDEHMRKINAFVIEPEMIEGGDGNGKEEETSR